MLHLLRYPPNFSSKVDTEFIFCNALCWWSVHVPPFHQTIINQLWSSGYLAPMLKLFPFKFWLFLLCILTPSPNGVLFCFNQFYKQFIVSLVYIYLALLTFGERSLWEEQKASSLFESGFAVTWERSFTTYGSFPVLTKVYRIACFYLDSVLFISFSIISLFKF